MKVKAAEAGRLVDAAGPDLRLYLFHGPDEATARSFAERLGRALGADSERMDIEPPRLKTAPGQLADEAAALSLFGGRRWIRIAGADDECLEAVELLLSAPRAGNPVVMIAPALKAGSAIVKRAAGDPAAAVCQLYAVEGAAAVRLAAEIAREQGLRLASDAAALLVSATGGDRALMTGEIEKLALYLDAAPDRPREAGAAVVAEIGADVPDAEIGPAVEAMVAGRRDDLGSELAPLSGTSPIPLLRAAVRRLAVLAEIQAQVAAGARTDMVLERVFWKEKNATAAALRHWPAPRVSAAIEALRRAERDAMIGAGDVAAWAAIMEASAPRAPTRQSGSPLSR